MLSVDVKIDRAQRLLHMLEQDVPRLAIRVAELTPDRQHSAKKYAAQLIAHTRAELEQLAREKMLGITRDSAPQPAD
jgi:hypothetical protein